MNESQKYHGKWNKADQKLHRYNSIVIKIVEISNQSMTEAGQWLPRTGSREWDGLQGAMGNNVGDLKTSVSWLEAVVSQVYASVKTQQVV